MANTELYYLQTCLTHLYDVVISLIKMRATMRLPYTKKSGKPWSLFFSQDEINESAPSLNEKPIAKRTRDERRAW